MAKSSRRITQVLNRLCSFSPTPQNTSSLQPLLRAYSASISPSRFPTSTNLTSQTLLSKPCFNDILSKPSTSPNVYLSLYPSSYHSNIPPIFGASNSFGLRFSTTPPGCLNHKFSSKPSLFLPTRSLGFSKLDRSSIGNRYLSFKSSDFKGSNGNFKKSVVDKPMSAARSAFLRYREAVGLQLEAFWKRNYLVIVGIGGLALCVLLWRIMFGIASTFIGLSEGMAKYGFLALSSAVVAFTGLYVRSRFTINPDKVYRIAMRKLNTSAGILEIMGAPLSGTELRAYVMSGGRLGLKDFKLKLRSKRCFLIFPIRGSERKGLVSVEVKKNKGQYDMRLLAVDIPMIAGPDQRFFLIGNEEEYQIGDGLISELRDPIVKAMAAEKEFEDLDQQEEEEDAERELEEAERKNREEIEKIEKGGQ